MNKVLTQLTEDERKEVGNIDTVSRQNNFAFVHFAARDFEPVGFITLDIDTAEQRVKAVGTTIAIISEYRHSDVSTELIQQANKFFANSDYEQWCYNVNTANLPSKKLAKKHGFSFAWDNATQEEYEVYIKTNPSLYWK